MRDRCGGYLLFTDTLSPINKCFVFLLFIITGIVRELHGMQNGFRCSDKGEPGDRGEKGDKGERGGPEGVSFFFWFAKLQIRLPYSVIGPDSGWSLYVRRCVRVINRSALMDGPPNSNDLLIGNRESRHLSVSTWPAIVTRKETLCCLLIGEQCRLQSYSLSLSTLMDFFRRKNGREIDAHLCPSITWERRNRPYWQSLCWKTNGGANRLSYWHVNSLPDTGQRSWPASRRHPP